MDCEQGMKYSEEKGKCVVSKKRYSHSYKKHYNPFKMWGSWVGAGIGLTAVWWSQFQFVNGICQNNSLYPIKLCVFQFIFPMSGGGNWQLIPYIPLYAIGGFLLGWGIHSIVRRLR